MRLDNRRPGQILIFFLALMAIGMLLATSALSFQGAVSRNAKQISQHQDVSYLAEAGIEKGFKAFTANQSYTGETLNLGNGSVVVTVTAGATANEKILSAVASVGQQKRQLRTKLVTQPTGVAVAFNYALQAGSLGFSIGNGSQITGNVYSNQNIAGSNGATVTGDAYAVGTITNLTVSGQKKTGQPSQPLPPFDAAFWKGKAQAGAPPIDGDYTPPDGSTIGPLYIGGNLTISNTSTVTFKGPVYVGGNITFGNGPTLVVDNSLGTQSVMLIADGTVSFGNTISVTNNQQGGHLLIASTNVSSSAISIGNGALTINAPLYTPNGGINIGNNAHAVAFTGKQVALGNGVIINYDAGLANASFTSGPGGTWTLQKGSYQEY